MKSKDDNFKIRDRRGDNRYFIDNVFLKTWGAKLGPHCIAAYNVLVMYSNADNQQAYPSFQTIADMTGMSRRQVIREIKKLEEKNIVQVKENWTPAESGKKVYSSNIFTLLHPDEWVKVGEDSLCESSDSESPPLMTDSHQPSDIQSPPLVTQSHPNNTNLNKTQLTKDSSPNGEGAEAPPIPKTGQKLEQPSGELRNPAQKSNRGKKPRAPDSPAFKVFTEITEYHAITTHWRDETARIVGEKVEDLEFWRKVIIGWTGKYKSKHNIEGMLDFYKRREIPGYDQKQNGAYPNGTHPRNNQRNEPTGQQLKGQSTYDRHTNELVYPDGTRVPAD